MTETRTPHIQFLVITVIQETKLYESTHSDEIISDVTEFLELQINLLPRTLRIAVRMAFSLFKIEPVVFHGKSFTKLSQQDQTEHMKRWDHSRLAAKRDFVRYVRSLVLFNYYDHPHVRSEI